MRVAAAGVCHSDLHLADGHLGAGRCRSCSATRAPAWSRPSARAWPHVAPGDRVAFCFVPPCGACARLRGGPAQPVRDRPRPRLGGHAAGRHARGCARRRRRRPALQLRLLLRRALRRARRRARSRSRRRSPLWQASLLGCGVVTGGRRGAQRGAGRARRDVCVVGCGGVGLQLVAAARLAGAGRIVAVERDPAKLALALARGATDAVDGRGGDPVAAVLAAAPAASTTRSRPSARPRRSGSPGTCCAPAPPRSSSASRPPASRSRCPRSSCSPRRASAAATTARATRPRCWPRWRSMAAAGRFPVADVVTHVTDLDGIEAAFERLRRGEGARTVALIDAALAGGPEPR